MNSSTRILLLAALIGGGCCSTAPVEPDTTTTDAQRREQARERLRTRLGAAYEAPIPAAAEGELWHGAKLYDLLCRACHGPTGSGTGRSARLLAIKPQDLTDPGTASFFSDRAKLEIVAHGIEGSPMIGWSDMLNETERLAVLHYMNSLIREPKAP